MIDYLTLTPAMPATPSPGLSGRPAQTYLAKQALGIRTKISLPQLFWTYIL